MWFRLKALPARVVERRAFGTHSVTLQVKLLLQLIGLAIAIRSSGITFPVHKLTQSTAIDL